MDDLDFEPGAYTPPEEDEEQIQPGEYKAPVLTASDYADPPGLLQTTTGFRQKELENDPIWQQMSQDPSFQQAAPSEQRRLHREAVDAQNQALYDRTGEQKYGIPIPEIVKDFTGTEKEGLMGYRTQQGADEDGNPETFVVPAPGSKGIDMLVGENAGRYVRSAAGGVLQAAKAIGQSGEYLTDKFFTDPDTNYVKENFPTLPPENEADDVVQEITSVLLGAGSGAGLASSLSKAYNLTPKYGKFLANIWSRLNKGKSPAEISTAAQTFAKTFILGTGANIGATITSPSSAEPLIGDDVVEMLGLDPEDAPNLSIFADNVAFSSGLMVLGKLFQGTKTLTGKVIKGGKGLIKNTRDADMGMQVFSELDPNIVGQPAEVIAERARIMGDVLQKNKSFQSELLGDVEINLDSPVALREGVQQYVDQAYAFKKTLSTPEEWAAFSEKLAGDIVSKMIDLRRTRLTAGANLKKADAGTVESMGEALDTTAEQFGGTPVIQSSVEGLTEPILKSLDDALENRAATGAARDATEATLNTQSGQNYIIERLREAIKNNPLGSNQTSQALLENLTGPQLYDAWAASRKSYIDAYDNLPEVAMDVPEFVKLITENSTALNAIDSVTLANQVSSAPFNKLIDIVRGYPNESSMEEVTARLTEGGISLTQAFKEIVPLLEDQIKTLKGQNQPFTKIKAMKDGIVQMAEQSGDPAFAEATAKWQKHKDTFTRTGPMEAYDAQAKRVAETSSGTRINIDNTYNAGMEALKASFGSGNSAWIKPFVEVMQQGRFDSANPELSEAFVGMAMTALGRSLKGGLVSSSAIIDSVYPYLNQLEAVSPDVVERFKSVVEDLQGYESGLLQADEVARRAEEAYQETLKTARNTAAKNFIFEIAGDAPELVQAPETAFKRIFENDNAPNIVDRLMDEADAMGKSELVKDGIKAAYTRWLGNFISVPSAGIGIGASDTTKTVRALSASKISNILDNPASPVLKTLNNVFKDEPERAAQFGRMIEIMDLVQGGKSIKGETFGSTTTYDQDLKKLMDRVVTLRYGVLNTKATITRNLLDALTKGQREKIQKSALETLDLMIARPEEFARVLELVASGQDDTALQVMTQYMSKAVFTGTTGSTDEQMDEMLPTEE